MNTHLHIVLTVLLILSSASCGWHISKRFHKEHMEREEHETVMLRFMLSYLVTMALSLFVGLPW